MKILFATEVFPIRNSFTEHSMVAREFLVNIATILHDKKRLIDDARLFCNPQIFELLVEEDRRMLPSIICLSDKASKSAKSVLKNWEIEGLRSWKEYVTGAGEFAEVLKEELLQIHNTIYSYDMIICWGENGVFDAIARQLDIPCFHVELSSTRSPFYEGRVIDPVGANGSASYGKMSTGDDLFKSLKAPPIDFWPAYFNIQGEDDTEKVGFDDSTLTYWEEDKTLEIFREGKTKTALIGLQLFDDANTQRHSSFNSPKEFLELVIPKLTSSGWQVIVKTHPGAIHRPINYIKQNEALKYAERFENVYIYSEATDSRNYLMLLKSIDLVVVINSSLGFEASLLGKPVVVLGDAIYKIEGVFPTLDEVLSDDWNLQRYLDALSPILYFFSKYVFVSREVFTKGEYYLAIKEYWENTKAKLSAGEFSAEAYVKYLGKFSRSFLGQSEYKGFVPSYLHSLPGLDGELVFDDNKLIFPKANCFVSVVDGIAEYNIEDKSKIGDSIYISGWAFCKNRGVPPVIVIIFSGEKLLHIGRLGVRREDVCAVFDLSNQFTGFKYRFSSSGSEDKLKVGFVFSDDTVDVVDCDI